MWVCRGTDVGCVSLQTEASCRMESNSDEECVRWGGRNLWTGLRQRGQQGWRWHLGGAAPLQAGVGHLVSMNEENIEWSFSYVVFIRVYLPLISVIIHALSLNRFSTYRLLLSFIIKMFSLNILYIVAIKMLLNKISNKSTFKVRENLFLVMWKAVLSPEYFMVGGDPKYSLPVFWAGKLQTVAV